MNLERLGGHPIQRNLAAEYAAREQARSLIECVQAATKAQAELRAEHDAACRHPLACRYCDYRARTTEPIGAGNWECPICGRMQGDDDDK